ncbi:MAG: hypothetical protein U0234_23400 [Sandaracinus sp.]
MATIAGREINRVAVVDDDELFRASLAEAVNDADLEALDTPGPLGRIEVFLDKVVDNTHAALCDHHLQKKKAYAQFNGASAVAELYKRRFPAILCTRWSEVDADEIRGMRRYVPVVLPPSKLESSALFSGWDQCIREFNGEFSQARKATRTLIRVEDLDDRCIYLIVPAFSPDRVISIRRADVPIKTLARMNATSRLYARTNLGAESTEHVYFEDWEF